MTHENLDVVDGIDGVPVHPALKPLRRPAEESREEDPIEWYEAKRLAVLRDFEPLLWIDSIREEYNDLLKFGDNGYLDFFLGYSKVNGSSSSRRAYKTNQEVKRMEGNKPEKKITSGAITVSVFRNKGTTKNGHKIEFRTVSLQRRYKDRNGNWQSTNTFRVNDIPRAVLLLSEAYRYLVMKGDENDDMDIQEEV